MKKFLKVFAVVAILCIVCNVPTFYLLHNNHGTYAKTTVVVELDKENDIVYVEDFNGFIWAFEGCEDWMVDDIASLMMNDKGTENIFDDEIVNVRYNGTFKGWK